MEEYEQRRAGSSVLLGDGVKVSHVEGARGAAPARGATLAAGAPRERGGGAGALRAAAGR